MHDVGALWEGRGEGGMFTVELSGQAASDVSGRFIRSAGLSSLSRSSNHTHETARRNKMNQIPATCRERAQRRLFMSTDPN
jgi:hypothetical protein